MMSDVALQGLQNRSRTYSPLTSSSVGGVRWPVDGTSLQALVDLGMTDQRIAEYFKVPVKNVTDLKSQFASKIQGSIR